MPNKRCKYGKKRHQITCERSVNPLRETKNHRQRRNTPIIHLGSFNFIDDVQCIASVVDHKLKREGTKETHVLVSITSNNKQQTE